MNSAVSTERDRNSCSWPGVDTPVQEQLFRRWADKVPLRATLDRNSMFRSSQIRTASNRHLVPARDAGGWQSDGRRREDPVVTFDDLAVSGSAELSAAQVDDSSPRVSVDPRRHTRATTDRHLSEQPLPAVPAAKSPSTRTASSSTTRACSTASVPTTSPNPRGGR